MIVSAHQCIFNAIACSNNIPILCVHMFIPFNGKYYDGKIIYRLLRHRSECLSLGGRHANGRTVPGQHPAAKPKYASDYYGNGLPPLTVCTHALCKPHSALANRKITHHRRCVKIARRLRHEHSPRRRSCAHSACACACAFVRAVVHGMRPP